MAAPFVWRIDIQRLPPHRRARRGIARTFQKVRLADQLTVYENVAAGLASQWFARASGWACVFRPLSAASIAQASTARWSGSGSAMSQAQLSNRCRSASATSSRSRRAIVAEPKLLLLDEPATGLTEPERERLAALVKDLAAQGCAQLLIEHDLELVGRLCHRVTVINQGHHVFTGTPAAAQSDPELSALIWA